MNYVISITGPEALGVLEDICEELALPLNVTLHGRGTAVQSMLDLLGIDLKAAWDALGEISGMTANEAIIDEIFAKFCVGK